MPDRQKKTAETGIVSVTAVILAFQAFGLNLPSRLFDAVARLCER